MSDESIFLYQVLCTIAQIRRTHTTPHKVLRRITNNHVSKVIEGIKHACHHASDRTIKQDVVMYTIANPCSARVGELPNSRLLDLLGFVDLFG